MPGVFLNPFEDFAVAFAFGEFLFQHFGINARKLEETLVQGTSVMIFTMLAGDSRTAFVEHSG